MHRCSPRYRPVSLSFWWNSRKLLGIFLKASVRYITNVQEDSHVRTLASVKTFIYANWVESHSFFQVLLVSEHFVPICQIFKGKNQDASL